MLQNRSIATIDAPEFINITPYNPLISECEIKVFYLGENRNHSYITKDVAIQMANSLPGTPIVGAWREDIEDFGDHGHVMKIEDGEIKFSCKTKPYGFVAPDAEVWFQKFKDTDEFGCEIEREYLMTTGYLWTGQYEEVQKVLDSGQPQSMELDEESVNGHWATNKDSGIDFFIINDALFSKLCILGDNVEPCFEGASVTSPNVSKEFMKDNDFSKTLFTMRNELKDALGKNEGGLNMQKDESLFESQAEESDSAQEVEFVEQAEESAETAEIEVPAEPEDFVKVENEEKQPATELQQEEEDSKEEEKEESKENKYTAEDFALLEQQIEEMEAELAELRDFKLQVINKEKDEIINRYHMLDVEDKKDIIDHKEEYSLKEIEAQLALLYVAKNVDFSTVDGIKVQEEVVEEENPITTFSLDSNEGAEDVPAFVEALRKTKK